MVKQRSGVTTLPFPLSFLSSSFLPFPFFPPPIHIHSVPILSYPPFSFSPASLNLRRRSGGEPLLCILSSLLLEATFGYLFSYSNHHISLLDSHRQEVGEERSPLKSSGMAFSRIFSQLKRWVYGRVGIVELCAKILQIMRNDFKDYAHTFCQLCAPFSIQISINQERK